VTRIDPSRVEERYRAATPRSAELYERATRSLPGGNTRSTIFFQPYPFYFDHGIGCRVYDVDGNERIDFINNYTSLILGHAHPKVTAAVQRQLSHGASAAAPSELEIRLAEEIRSRLPSIELLRFTNSGTEATMLAIRAARAFTRREKIAKFEGSYHGTHDYAAVDASAATAAMSGSQTKNAGIPKAVTETVVSLPLNDREAVERELSRHRQDLAALIIEPVIGAGGILIPEPGFLAFLREVTRRYGVVLIFDEVISFRIGYHGAQGHFGVFPDLTTMGKIIGGGFAVGAFGGRADIMALFDPRRSDHIGHGGTFNGHPVTMAAGLATLEELTPETFDGLARMGAELREKLLALFRSVGIPAQVNQIGSLFNIHFTDVPVTDHAAVQAGDAELQRDLYLAALDHGIAFTGRGMGCLSTPMTAAEIDRFVAATREALSDLGAA
jgi:glutamate-1-semialdehyde 2,1-aminomutase